MPYHTNKQLKRAKRFYVLKRVAVTIILISTLFFLTSCSLVTKQLDKQTGFSKQLVQVENNVRNEDWTQAKRNLEDAKKTWEKIKPFMQIDIDHDYIKDIEDNFTKLKGYIDSQDKPNSLPTIMLIEETWENIDSL